MPAVAAAVATGGFPPEASHRRRRERDPFEHASRGLRYAFDEPTLDLDRIRGGVGAVARRGDQQQRGPERFPPRMRPTRGERLDSMFHRILCWLAGGSPVTNT